MQLISTSKPIYVVTDKSPKLLSVNEAVYLKNYRTTFNLNSNGSEGGNFGKGTPNRSNKKYALVTLPAGINYSMGTYECEETNETYFANWNSNGLHGWYIIYGETLLSDIICVDPELKFSLDPAYKIAPHRVFVDVIYERTDAATKIIKEKHLIYTTGEIWQNWINVIASIKTNGFDASKFQYWTLRAPHYDRAEYFSLVVRPPMFAPVVIPITPTLSDIGKPNAVINKSIQFAYKFIYTDNRATTASPYSNPVAQSSSSCNANNAGLPRGYNVKLNVGSAMVEKIQLMQRLCGGDWYLYDTIERFGPTESVGDEQYWLRTGDWSGFNYNPDDNTITYPYFGDRQLGIIDQDDFNIFQSDCPLLSVGLGAAGDAILLADNLYGYNNLSKNQVANFVPGVIPKSDQGNLLQTRKISLYAYLAKNGSTNQFIWINGADKTNRFGGISYQDKTNSPGFSSTESDYFKMSVGASGGFVAYLAGTDYYAISRQFFYDPTDGTFTEQDTIDESSGEQKQLVIDFLNKGGYVVQRFDFVVPAGRYIARLAKHGVDLTTNYSKTSTWVLGIADKTKIHNFNGLPNFDYTNAQLDTINKEMEIDVCSGDFDAWTTSGFNMFYIFIPYIISTDYRFIEGNVYEDAIGVNGVELLDYDRANPGGLLKYFRKGNYTDANGFFFAYMAGTGADKAEIVFRGSVNCKKYAQIAATKINLNGTSKSGYYAFQNISIKDNVGSYGPCNRILIKGSIVDNISGIGYEGISVTSTRGATTNTDSNGNFELAVHDNGNVNDGIGFERTDKIYINSGSGTGCFLVPLTGNCFDVIPYDLSLSPCITCLERDYPVNSVIKVKVLNQLSNSVKDGGGFGVSFHLMDLAGRTTFEQEIGVLDIPTFMESKGIILSQIKVDMLADLVVSPDFKYLIFSRTSNLKVQKYLQWVGDKIEFLDKNGSVTTNGSGAIRARITLQSLLDYNQENNFSTTATYQFTKGDILRFYDDGSGNLFDPTNGGLLDFPILGTDFAQTVEGSVAVSSVAAGITTTTTTPVNNDGNTLIIAFDKRLLALNGISSTNDGTNSALNACGFWIEIQTPKNTAQVDTYCEVIGTYPIINGVLPKQTFLLDTFDTYYQTRDIHISQCTGKAILHPFASSSISDYFGAECNSCGRKLVKDPLAQQEWFDTDVIKSDDKVNNGRVNGFSRFRGTNRKQYKGQETGGIVAIHAQNKIVFFLCLNDWFLADYDTNFAQASANGLLVANFTGELGEPDQKVRGKFGCAFEDTGTIVINDMDGLIFWADSENEAVVLFDYRNAYDLAETENKGYFSDKFNFVRKFNALLSPADYLYNLFEKSMIFDYKFKELHISFRPRNGMSSNPQYFTNTERGKFIPLPETFTYSTDLKHWNQWQTFVGENYINLRKAASGNELIAFMAGVPYFHNSKDVNTYNNFFGVQDTQVIEVAFNDKNKDKTYQALTIESPLMGYFVDRILTDNSRNFTYIPFKKFKLRRKKYYASVLLNMASYPDFRHPVLSMLNDGGGKISGEFCIVRFVRDLNRMDEYNEIDSLYMQFIGFEKSK